VELLFAASAVVGLVAGSIELYRWLRRRAAYRTPNVDARLLPPELATAAGHVPVVGFFPAVSHHCHNAGSPVADGDAYQRRAWQSAIDDPGGHVVYGPYVLLSRDGDYGAWFRLRFTCPAPRDDLGIIRLEAKCDDAIKPRILRQPDNPGSYRLYYTSFSYNRGQKVELRVEKLTRADVSVDYTAITGPP